MRGLFGLGRIKDKLQAQRFEYAVTIHNLQPWPDSGNRAVAVGWQRGKKKRGATRSVYPSTQPGKLGNVARFNEKFELSATLYKAPNGSANANQLGPFKKKCLILAILETDGRTQATAALGRVVIDLAEFAAIDKQETRAFMVSCNKHIHAAVGEPQLLITIRTRWKKSSATVGASGDPDETGSMSTDTTGSRMTANLSSFLRYKYTGQGPSTASDEQDLRGFDSMMKNSQRNRAAGGEDKSMNAIHEDEEAPDSPSGAGAAAAVAAGVAAGRQQGNGAAGGLPPRPKSAYAAGLGSETYSGGSASEAAPNSLRARYGGSVSSVSSAAAGAAVAGLAAGAAAGRMAHLTLTPPSSNGHPGGSPRSTLEDGPGGAQGAGMHGAASGMSVLSTPHTAVRAMGLQHAGSLNSMGEAVSQELVLTAASEMTVHMARAVASGSKRPERAAHAAARRMVRTMVCLGPQQAPVFGLHVLRLIGGQVECGAGDLATLAFWWSNLAHTRALLLQCTSTATMPAPVSDSLLPQVMALERTTFDAIVHHLWEGVLLPAITDAGAGGTGRAAPATAASKRAQQEAAIKRWFEGLRLVSGKLARLHAVSSRAGAAAGGAGGARLPVPGHVALLRQQALLQCLKRVDALLFHHLVSQANKPSVNLMSDYDPANSVWGQPGAPPPALDDASLPFTRGLLTFGSGMGVKMTVTRLQQWATSEGGLADTSGLQAHGGLAGAPPALFPLLRAAADLLMMPKELLMEPTIRRDVCQALSIRSMLHILEAFQPDEYAVDAISPDILRTLREEELRWGGGRPTLTDLSVGYRPPLEEQLLVRVNAGAEPGVEYDADSEDELVGFGSMAAPPGTGSRFRHLHELWYTGARFRGALSVASSSRMGSAA